MSQPLVMEPGTVGHGAGLGHGGLLVNDGVPTNGTNEVWTIAAAGATGTFTITYDGYTTAPIAVNATAAAVAAAVNALPSSQGGNGFVGGGGPLGTAGVTLTAANLLQRLALPTDLVIDSTKVTAGTVTATQTTPGVTATKRLAAKGALLIDATNALLYQNSGSPPSPAWNKVGLQT